MTEDDAIPRFLATAGWSAAARAPLAGDASARRYERLNRDGEPAILMISPAPDEVARFARVDAWLTERGFSAPRVYAEDTPHGLMLLEDLGDALLSRLLAAEPGREAELYARVTETLLALHRHAPPDFAPSLDGAGLAALAALAAEWWPTRDRAAAGEIPALIAGLYDGLDALPPALSLRDLHAENAIWLPDRAGAARLGLLDFQDAVATHPAYDLASALQDARRDVSAATEAREIARYVKARALDPDAFAAAYALIGAQRALRILGVFARLGLRDGRPQYLDFAPRVWANLIRDLRSPSLAPLSRAVEAAFAPASAATLADLRSRCPKP